VTLFGPPLNGIGSLRPVTVCISHSTRTYLRQPMFTSGISSVDGPGSPHASLWCQVSSVGLNLNSVNQLIFVMVKCGVLFEVRTEFLNNI
jgi:hypothetical protein